jgi:carboxylesterase
MANAEPFVFHGNQRGVLLIHGFGGTPFEMRYLGQELNRAGYTTLGTRLAGHGTNLNEFTASLWPDWLDSVERAFSQLQAICQAKGDFPAIHVVGQSLGSTLSLLLAHRRRNEIASLGLLATALWLPPYSGLPLDLIETTRLYRILPPIPKIFGSDVRDRDQRQTNPAYGFLSLPPLISMARLMRMVRGLVPSVDVPALILHARRDHTIPYACSEELAQRLPNGALLPLHDSFHLISIDRERERVARELCRFFANVEENDRGQEHTRNRSGDHRQYRNDRWRKP